LEIDRVLIGIDARELCGKPTGVGRYLASLLTAWDRLPEVAAHRFVLYVPPGAASEGLPERLRLSALPVEARTVPSPRPASTPSRPDGSRPATGPAAVAGTLWEQVHLARALRHDRPDVVFAPAYTAPLAAGVPVVLTIHDLSFVAHPEWFPVKTRWRQRLLTTMAARRARHVLTDSEFSRGEIVARLGVTPANVSAVPLGLTAPFGSLERRPGNRREPVVLFVGSIFNRRHLPEVIRAVATAARRHPDIRLEVVGDNRTFPRQDLAAMAQASGIGGRTTIRSYVSDEVLADLYDRAGLFVFLSDYEGFGLTPLEALSCGVPILVGDTAVAREVYGDAGAYVPTTDGPAIVAGIERLLFDTTARDAVLSRAPAVLQRYSWERAGRDTLSVLLDSGTAMRS
jgi:glycosyltransferase involved in cell wall biosynthesis